MNSSINIYTEVWTEKYWYESLSCQAAAENLKPADIWQH